MMQKKFYFFKYLLALLITQLLITNYSLAQQIVTDNFTNTTLNVNGNTTNVTTTTLQGANAFNSFTRFNVNNGNVVNLVVPDNATNLINIVKNEASQINGTLNSLKNGVLGGNVYLVNPHGIFVGQQGAINVGSLIAVTPTQAFVDNFFTAPGNPDPESVNTLLNDRGSIQLASTINNAGTISAQQNLELDTGSMVNTGTIQMTDLVNVNNLTNGNVLVNSGSTIDVSGVIRTAGKISLVANGSITENSAGEQPNLIANNMLLQAFLPGWVNASIGTLKNDINLASPNQANPELQLETLSANDTCLTMNQGNLKINKVRSLAGHVFLTAAGDILNNKNDGTAVILANDITLNSNNGDLGNWDQVNSQPLTLALNNGMVTASAKQWIYLSSPGGTLGINQIQNNGINKIIVSADNGMTNGPKDATPNFITNDLTLKSSNGSIGGADFPINMNLGTNETRGTIDARALQDIYLNNKSDSANINLRKLLASTGSASFTTNSGIQEAPDHEEITVGAQRNITFIAVNQSSIGMDNDPIDLCLGGKLQAQGYGYINIKSHGNLTIDLVSNAGRYPVQLTSTDQYIADSGRSPSIITDDLILNTPKGSVDLDVDSNHAGKGGSVTANAWWKIILTETNGDLKYDQIQTQFLDINLVSQTGSILQDGFYNQPTLIGRRIDLTAANNIGGPIRFPLSNNNCLFIKNINDGFISATSQTGSINIGTSLDTFAETNNDIYLYKINAPSGKVAIQSGNNIYSASFSGNYINAQSISFYTTSRQPYRSLGTQDNPININRGCQITRYGFANVYINQN